MAETLSVIVDLAISGETDVQSMVAMLEELDFAISDVDGENINIGVRGEGELAKTNALLAAMNLQMASLRGMGPLDVGAGGIGGAGGGVAQTMTEADRAADSFIDNLKQGTLRMSSLHNILARLIPLLLVFVGALPALIAGTVALAGAMFSAAAAMAAIAGFGALGLAMQLGGGDVMSGFQRIAQRVKRDFFDAFAPLAEDLAPLFEDGLKGLERLFNEIAKRGDVLRNLEDDARAFGGFLIDFIPDMLANMGRLAEVAGPVFAMIADFFREFSLSQAFAEILADTLPALTAFAQGLAETLGPLIRMSTGFLVVANAVGRVIGLIGKLFSLLGLTAEETGTLIATVLSLTTAYLILASSGIGSALVSLGAYILQLGSVIKLQGLATAASIKWANAMRFLQGMIAGTTAATTALRAAVVGLAAATGIGLVISLLGQAIASFINFGGSVSDATDRLREFKDASEALRDTPFGAPGAGLTPGSIGAARKVGGEIDVTIAGRERGTNRRRGESSFKKQSVA